MTREDVKFVEGKIYFFCVSMNPFVVFVFILVVLGLIRVVGGVVVNIFVVVDDERNETFRCRLGDITNEALDHL